MSFLLRCGGMMRPLVLLLVVARCSASQQQPAVDLNTLPDELWRFIELALKSELQPLISKLDARMDSLDSRLDLLDSRLDALDSRVDALTVQQYSRESHQDGSVPNQYSQDSRLDGLASQLANQDSRLDRLASQLDSQDSRLDGLASQMDSQDTRLDGLASQLANQDSRLDGLASQLANQDSRLDGLASQLDSRDSRLNGLASQLASQDSRLDGLATKTDNQQAPTDGMTTKLDQVQAESGSAAPSPRDCSDLPAGAQSGVHLLQLGLGRPVPAYCDLDTDGGNWTVFQRRADTQGQVDFFLDYRAYKEGFGDLDEEFWWGLDHVWMLTSPENQNRERRTNYELRIDLEDFDGGKRHAVYQGFQISSEEDGHRLTAANYTGDAGNSLKKNIGQKFTTKDRDQDTHGGNCAREYQGAWWYPNGCGYSNLNGRYLSGPNTGNKVGVDWFAWRGFFYSLKAVEMKMRPSM